MRKMQNKKPRTEDREQNVLSALIEIYLEEGSPVSSQKLQQKSFSSLNTSTLRGYLARLEKQGFIEQKHTSGGRCPTRKGLQWYIQLQLQQVRTDDIETTPAIEKLFLYESNEPSCYLQESLEKLSQLTECAIALSAPRFAHNEITAVNVMQVDDSRYVYAFVTRFGTVHTHTLFIEHSQGKVNTQAIAMYLQTRLNEQTRPQLNKTEEKVALRIYRELALKHLSTVTGTHKEDIYTTGLSQLLRYSIFTQKKELLLDAFHLWEDHALLRKYMRDYDSGHPLSYRLGADLNTYGKDLSGCLLIIVPYHIGLQQAGSLLLLGPELLAYKKLFNLLLQTARCIGLALNKSIELFHIPLYENEAQGALSTIIKYQLPDLKTQLQLGSSTAKEIDHHET